MNLQFEVANDSKGLNITIFTENVEVSFFAKDGHTEELDGILNNLPAIMADIERQRVAPGE